MENCSGLGSGSGYRGWRNFGTWSVFVWLTQDYAMHREWMEAVEDCRQSEWSREELAQAVKESIVGSHYLADTGPCPLASDLVCSALLDVDWMEFADALLGSMPVEAEEDLVESLFHLGPVIIGASVRELLDEGEMKVLLARHSQGDWGDIEEADHQANDGAVLRGERILSVYATGHGISIWVITEPDRSATTVAAVRREG